MLTLARAHEAGWEAVEMLSRPARTSAPFRTGGPRGSGLFRLPPPLRPLSVESFLFGVDIRTQIPSYSSNNLTVDAAIVEEALSAARSDRVRPHCCAPGDTFNPALRSSLSLCLRS